MSSEGTNYSDIDPGYPEIVPADLHDLWDMEQLVVLSLLSDAREPGAEGLDGHGGWWGGAELPTSEPFGSLLWTFFRKSANQTTAASMAQAAEDALRWLISQGLADQVDVRGEFEAPSTINLYVTVTRGDRNWTFRFADLWRKYV